MALYDITLLQSTLAPVATSLTVEIYSNPTPGMTAVQMASFIASAVPAASGMTDINGHLQATLTSGQTYLLTVTGYTPVYITPGTPSVLFATVLVPTALCRVTGTITGTDGTAQANVTVTANLNASGPLDGTNLILASAPSTTTNSSGHWELDLMPNELITPKNTLYTFVFTQPATVVPAYPFFSFGVPVKPTGPSVSRVVEVPNVSAVDFSTLVG